MSQIVTAEDMARRDTFDGYTFCCPLVGAYPCEQLRRGCYCHELHLINEHDREKRVQQWWRDASAELRDQQQAQERPGPPYDAAYEQNHKRR